MNDAKTTTQAAEILGVKRNKLDSILKKYPSYKPTATFGGRPVWEEADITKARLIVNYVLHGACPHCERLPGVPAETQEEPTDAS